MTAHSLEKRALLINQNSAHPLYLFALTADEIEMLADISRISRGDDGELVGYQRQEVRSHIDGIVDYLDSEAPLLPNALVIAFDSTVRFVRSRGPQGDDGAATSGRLSIPLPRNGETRPGWIVDGQQRSIALRKSKRRDFPVPVAAFVADTIDVQRDQFVRVNNTKPLPTGLVTELLPTLSTPISPRLAAKKLPSALVHELNTQEASPFRGMIRRPSMTSAERKAAVITDTSLVNGIEEALQSSSSCLFPYRNIASGETDVEGIWNILICYWAAVAQTFDDAWGLPAQHSRLMHGVGIRSMSRLMDRVMSHVDPTDDGAVDLVARDLARIKPNCRWTGGYWEDLNGVAWNKLQNTTTDIKLLSNHLARIYLRAE
jgi:DGQHR domain-containing protein